MTAAERWAAELAAWAIPEEIMAQAPESPWRFSPQIFKPPAAPVVDTPSRLRAREALPEGGTVLDVGCGGGAAGLALVPPAAFVTGFDQSRELLDAFEAGALELGVTHRAVQGNWPEDAGGVAPADVAVCHHVAYNIPGLGAFAAALSSHARRRVVVELTGKHPRYGANFLWRHFWGVDRPEGPTADDAVAVLREAGIEPQVERAPRLAGAGPAPDAVVSSLRRYLCLPAERDPEIAALLDEHPRPPGEVVTLWWEGSAGAS